MTLVNCFEENVDFILGGTFDTKIDELCKLDNRKFIIVRALFHNHEKLFYCFLSVL